MLVSKDYKYLPMTLDPSVSSSVAYVYSNGDTHMLLFYQICTVNMTYNVRTKIISLEVSGITTVGAKVYMFFGDGYVILNADENGVVKNEGFVLTESGAISLCNSAFDYLPMILEPSMDNSLGELYTYEDMTMLIVSSAGTYNLYYNLNTGIVLLESVTTDTE